MPVPTDTREFTRVGPAIAAEIECDGAPTERGSILNVSMNGALLAFERPPAVGTPCRVVLLLGVPGEEMPVPIEAQVVRIAEEGVALAFRGIPLESYEHLRNLVLYNARAEETAVVERELGSHLGLRPRD